MLQLHYLLVELSYLGMTRQLIVKISQVLISFCHVQLVLGLRELVTHKGIELERLCIFFLLPLHSALQNI